MTRISLLTASVALVLTLAGCSQHEPATETKPAAENAAPSAGKASEESKEAAEAPESGPIQLSDEDIKAAGIRTETIEEATVHERIPLTATIQANQERLAHVAPRVPGRIVALGAKLGDRVKAGQALASLDSIELGEAHSTYLQADSQWRLAQADFERAEKLYGEQIVPQKDYLRSRADYEKARANLQAATDKLRLMGVTPAKSDKAVSVFPVTAPFAGTVIEKQAVLGDLAPPDKALFVVADLSTVWIEANLFEKDLGKVRVGSPATVTVAAYPNEFFKGRLTYISSVMDKESRTVKARVEVPNADGRLKPDMFATAAVETAAAGKALTVPASAVLLIEGKKVVFVREKAGFKPQPVELGDNVGGRLVVKDGLEEGEAVVVEGAYALKARLLKSKIGDHD
ncbi:MAG: efflux RND transporter periplasmic adaptor subunit [Pseudomonadota bacterium]